MVLGFSTVACQELSWKETANYALAAGISHIEVRLHGGDRFFDLPTEKAAAVAAKLRDMGITVTDLGTSVAITGWQEEKLLQARECIDLASAVGAPAIRVFLGRFITKRSEPSGHDHEGIVRTLRELCAYGAKRGVEVWVETHNAFSAGAVLAGISEDVPGLRFIWDIIHPLEMGEAPEETLAHIGSRIAHVHIKDGIPQADPDALLYRYTRLGEGQVPIGRILRLLRQYGYAGCLSLEWENAWRPELQGVFADLPALLANYRACMERVW